ncbi:MAG TPA: hypothetical protein VFS00_08430, partial [Polyangiaceae bacterium]|nr:hypothetical protein [Polyangiaceae bacterium]
MNKIAFRSVFSFALFASAFGVVACDRETPRIDVTTTRPGLDTPRDGKVGTTPMTDKTTVNNEAAIQAIANSRCTREARCNNVGGSKRWASAEACRTDL